MNQNAYAQQENEEVMDLLNDEINENLDEDDEHELPNGEQVENLPPASVHTTLLSEEELNSGIESLNTKQREIFDVVYTWAKKFVQNKNIEKPIPLKPLQIFLSAAGGCGKSYLVKCMYNVLNKLLNRKGDASKAKILLLAQTGVAAINIDGTTIHTGLGIPCNNFIPLSDKQRTNLRLKLEEVSVIFIDEISMVGSKLLLQIHQRLCEIFGMSDRIPFANKTIIASGDLYQLPPVLAKPVFSIDGFVIALLKVWHNFKFAELDEVMRQQGDNKFIELLNSIRIGCLTEPDEFLLKSRFVSMENQDYQWNALHIFAENYLVGIHNQRMLDTLNSTQKSIFAIDKYPDGISQKIIDTIKNKKLSDTGGLPYNLILKIGARVMLTTNIDLDDRLINGQIGTVKHFAILNGRFETIFIQFDDAKAGNKRKSNINYVPIERTEAKFNVSKRRSVMITRTQFPLTLSFACTVHKVQGLTQQKIVVSFQLNKQRSFNPGQMYVALSRVTSLNGLFLIGDYSKSAFKANTESEKEYLRLKNKENLLDCPVSLSPQDNNLVVTLLNIRSLNKKYRSIKNYEQLVNNDLLLLTETHFTNESNTEEISKHLNSFSMYFNNDVSKYKSLALGLNKSSVQMLDVKHVSGFSIVKFSKESFNDRIFTAILLYRSHQDIITKLFL